jgi:hypothetical protein
VFRLEKKEPVIHDRSFSILEMIKTMAGGQGFEPW